jgi:NIMA (never in mitosis gene a)-related kinase
MGCCDEKVIVLTKKDNQTENQDTCNQSEIKDDEKSFSIYLRELNTLQEPSDDKYTIVGSISQGAYGKIYLIKNEKDEQFAVKKTVSNKSIKSVLTESKILQKCYHPNIIHYKELFKERKEDVILNLIIEYANGGDLKNKLNEQLKGTNFFEEKLLLNWLMQICLGLSYLHKRKIIHRDIKPENILLLKNGLIKITDFGLSKTFKSKKDLEKKNTLAGTYFYLSPEIKTTRIYSEKTDIYSLGKTFYSFIESKDRYSEEFIKLIDDLRANEENNRPSADEILEYPIIKNKMKEFLDDNNYNKSMAYTIMENYKKDEKSYNRAEELFICDAKKEWDELFKEKGEQNINNNERRAKRDFDILMCIIDKRIYESEKMKEDKK